MLQHHDRIVLDWGFPPVCYPWVKQLRDHGVKLVWFDGDIVAAQKIFEKRGGISIERVQTQIQAIKKAGYPAALDCVIVQALSANEVFLDAEMIARELFV